MFLTTKPLSPAHFFFIKKVQSSNKNLRKRKQLDIMRKVLFLLPMSLSSSVPRFFCATEMTRQQDGSSFSAADSQRWTVRSRRGCDSPCSHQEMEGQENEGRSQQERGFIAVLSCIQQTSAKARKSLCC